MLVTPGGTASVSALLWRPMPRLAVPPGRALAGEVPSFAVSLLHIQPKHFEVQAFNQNKHFVLCGTAIFCDYYNSPGDCEWHYKACGADCMKTCRNPSGNCSTTITNVEGTHLFGGSCPDLQLFINVSFLSHSVKTQVQTLKEEELIAVKEQSKTAC